MQRDSGYSPNWMADIVRLLPKQTIHVVPAGAGVWGMKEEYGHSLQDRANETIRCELKTGYTIQ